MKLHFEEEVLVIDTHKEISTLLQPCLIQGCCNLETVSKIFFNLETVVFLIWLFSLVVATTHPIPTLPTYLHIYVCWPKIEAFLEKIIKKATISICQISCVKANM